MRSLYAASSESIFIINSRILSPYFYDESLTAERYLDCLRLELVPALTVMFPNDVDPDIPSETVWFQQDGATPHFGINARGFSEIFAVDGQDPQI